MKNEMGSITVLAGLLGAGTGVGLLLVVIGSQGAGLQPDALGRRRLSGRFDRRQRVRCVGAVAVAVVAWLGTGWLVGAVLAGGACWALPSLLGRDKQHASRVARVEAIAAWTEMLRDTLSAAAGLEQAILATAPLAPAPIRAEIAALTARIENGQRLAPALRQLADDLADPTGDLVIAALVLAAEQQARQLGDLLGSLAQSAREQASMRLRVEAGRARTRTSVRVIVSTTVVFAIGMVLFNRAYMSAFDTPSGQIVLLGIGIVFASGFIWLTKIANVAEPQRFLAKAAVDPESERQVRQS